MKRRILALATTSVAVAGLVTALTSPAASATDTMENALQRDLHLTAAQTQTLLAAEDHAAKSGQTLRKQLAGEFGGAWFDQGTQRLVVGVTNAAAADAVRATGAEPRLVARSEAQLNALKAKLDAVPGTVGSSIYGWSVDVTTNTVTIETSPSGTMAAKWFAARAGLGGDSVRFVRGTAAPRPLIDVIGGNAYYINGNTRCSIGFSVTNGGFVTAGHCGTQGASTTTPSGSFAGSSFPGNDYAWVRVAAGNNLTNLVKSGSGTVSIAGSQDAAVGASICRSGSTTGWRCGTIQARNSTVNYPQGSVTGLIKTSACAEGGDSGGSAVSGTQAQGVTSGGSGNCSSGGTTYFQPVNEILQVYGLTLKTSGGPGPDPGCANPVTGQVNSGASQYQPSTSGFTTTTAGTIKGCLDGPTGADFDLYLQKSSGGSWTNVAKGDSPQPDETVTYTSSPGTYRWQVQAYSGSGSYTLTSAKP